MPAHTHKLRRHARSTLQLAGLIGTLLVGRASFADHYHIPSGSMTPTLQVGDHLAVDKRAYGLRVPGTQRWLTESEPSRGDVVVFERPDTGQVLVKRLVALPGDRVSFDGHALWINGQRVPVRPGPGGALLESLGAREHAIEPGEDQGPPMATRVIPPRRYLVLGDHRGDSLDSRFWGLVPRENLLGRAVAVMYSRRDGLALTERFWLPLDAPTVDPRLLR